MAMLTKAERLCVLITRRMVNGPDSLTKAERAEVVRLRLKVLGAAELTGAELLEARAAVVAEREAKRRRK